jgi:hypothetical protein
MSSGGLKASNLMSNAPPFSLLSSVQSIHLSYGNGIWVADLDDWCLSPFADSHSFPSLPVRQL